MLLWIFVPKLILKAKKEWKNRSIFKIETKARSLLLFLKVWNVGSNHLHYLVRNTPTLVNSSTWVFLSALCVLRTEAPPSFDLHAFWEQSSFWPSIIVVPSGLTTTDSWSCCWDDWRIIAIRVFWPCLSIFTETWWARRVESSINFGINFDTNSLSRT